MQRFRAHLKAVVAAAAMCAGCSPQACQEPDTAIEREVEVLVGDIPSASKEAARRLVARGRDALVILETGLYDAEPQGRLRLLGVLADIGDVEALPILRHFAAHDPDPLVRERAVEAAKGLETTVNPPS